jgi:DNA-binding response OmpR family regulator
MASLAALPAPPLRDASLDSPAGATSVSTAILAGIGRQGTPLVAGLEGEGVHTWSADHAAEAIGIAAESPPDLILIGEELDADPSTVLEALRRAAPHARVLFLLGSPGIRRAAFLLSLGVDDVIPPPHDAAGVLLRAAMAPLIEQRGRSRESNGTQERRLRVDHFSRMVLDRKDPAVLTVRELELLERLLNAEGKVVSREDLLEDIWGEEQQSEAVLDATVHRLRRKLEADPSAPRLLVTIRGVGYRLENTRISLVEQ